jgi:flagellar basal-body rod protein FlgG
MMQSVYTARLGISAQQKRVDAIANNIANMNTYGFRSSRVQFKDALYTAMVNPEGTQSNNLQQGNGVLVSSISHSFEEGTPVATEQTLDFCLEGDGFFTVADGQGTLQYTRSGYFGVSKETGGNYLVSAEGYYVLDTKGSKIKLPDDIEDLKVNAAGQLSIGDAEPFTAFGIASFANNEGLSETGGNYFVPTLASGAAKASQSTTVKQGYLESSNVDFAQEMTRLIRAQRAFSLASKALTTADEMDSTANNMR